MNQARNEPSSEGRVPTARALAEVATASPWCQRWRDRRPTWQHVHGERFDPDRYEVHALDEPSAKRYVVANHYAASYPAARLRFGLHEHGQLVGVAVFGIPMTRSVLTNAFPDLDPYVESLELSRFVLDDACPANAESWFLARCFTELLARNVRGVVSFADPVPRHDRHGQTILVGHVGTIYQATNATYAGRSTARTITVLGDGTTITARALAKIRNHERGHAHVERRLVNAGARPPRPSEHPTAWLTDALNAAGAHQLRHRGCHRYLFPLGPSARARQRITLGLPAGRYPKTIDHPPDTLFDPRTVTAIR